MFNLSKQPKHYQISLHLSNLSVYFNTDAFRELEMKLSKDIIHNGDLDRHIDNLVNYYGRRTINAYIKSLKKAAA